jgi:hypothetical protein
MGRAMSRIMSEEAQVYFAVEAALNEQRDEMRFTGARDAAALQAWLRRVFGGPADAAESAEGVRPTAAAALLPLERRARLDIDDRVLAMLALDAIAAAR